MATLSNTALQTPTADIYTDLNSLQRLKNIDNKDEALKQLSQQFESIFIHMMLKSMRDANAVFEKDSFFNSGESDFYRDMYDQQLSLSLSHTRGDGVGIASALYRQLSDIQAKQTESDAPVSIDNINRGNQLSGSVEIEQKTKRMAIAASPEAFIQLLDKPIGRAAEALGVDKNVLLAQAALETGWGREVLAVDEKQSSYNLFNIKAGKSWQGETVNISSLEYRDGVFKPESSKFRAYSSLQDSIDDYVRFVQENPRYQQALEHTGSSAEYIRKLHQAGYATDPEYANKVLALQQRIDTTLLGTESEVVR